MNISQRTRKLRDLLLSLKEEDLTKEEVEKNFNDYFSELMDILDEFDEKLSIINGLLNIDA